ncbi:copper homeostasis/adhesion lipoprotein NlpE [Photorhabdus luminescens]|uniref:Copper homeostasis/adhesion lipoprotein NlpE n=2 Tax=Photorhabdus TaxID=29487 RepID=A0A2S8Q4M7_9GAMM|nr:MULTISPECIES: envelope stress response activation lipoprotein NlpE [Photorhabdus]PQQ27171.1 copper homeostasis/adhesion lipoprotein NlpE [Photorhabdus hindustanensis]QXF32399.1 copper homeostasis/adhesion lipoprotein NlpE [Photorhabdus akhurstii]UJD74194.1 copper homeostasis/adhesion lipoprotein NlpE [Photorhabdus luminescens]
MNKKLLTALVAVGVSALMGCKGNSAQQTGSQPVDQTFHGTLPCADCSGIDTTLLLDNDGTYILEQTYLDTRDGDQSFFESGLWAKDGEKIHLTKSDDQKSYYLPKGENLVMLDIEGNKIESSFNYELQRVKPKKLAGEYSYMADAALFTDCSTGKRYAVTESLDLEQGYHQVGVEGGTPVYVEVEGYYSVRPSMEDGQFDSALIQTGKIHFDKSKSCNMKK